MLSVRAARTMACAMRGACRGAAVRAASTRASPEALQYAEQRSVSQDHAARMAAVSAAFSSPSGHTNPSSRLRSPLMEPKFWTGHQAVPESKFVIDCSEFDLPSAAAALEADGPSAAPKALQERITETYDRTGLVLLTSTGLGDHMGAMRGLAYAALPKTMKYVAGSNSRDELAPNVFDTGAPKEAWLHYHHEMAYVGRSTRQIGFCCSHAIEDGAGTGATFVSEAVGHTEELLATPLGAKLRDLGITYVRCLMDAETGFSDAVDNDESPVYNFWQKSFGTTSQEEAEAEAKQQGLEVEWGANRFMRTKFTVDAYEFCPALNRNLLYAAVADDSIWFDTWPGVLKLPTMDHPSDSHEFHRPLKITFGDGSDFTREELQTLIDVYDKHGVRIDWRQGDVAVMCNHRWAHGRPAYDLLPGQRRMLGVILGETYQRIGEKKELW